MKSKKILTILLSLAIMFTFMPAMAFAAAPAYTSEWTNNYQSVTVTKTATGEKATYSGDQIKYTWIQDFGAVVAEVNTDGYQAGAVPELMSHAEPAFYYDFNNSMIASETTATSASAVGKTKIYTYGSFNDAYDSAKKTTNVANNGETNALFGIVMLQPSYTVGYAAASAGAKMLPSAGTYTIPGGSEKYYGFEITINVDGFTSGSFESQSPVLSANVVPAGTGSATSTTKSIGTVPERTVSVNGDDPAVSKVIFGVDKLAEDGTSYNFANSIPYDGESHTIVNNTVPGVTVEYEVQDAKTKAWTSASPITVRDADTYKIRIKKYTAATKATATWENYDLTVAPAPSFAFSWDASVNKGKRVDVANDAEAASFVVSNVKDADKEEAMKFFASKYDVTVTPETANPENETWSFSVKKDYAGDTKNTEFAQFLANYSKHDYTFIEDQTTKRVIVKRSAAASNDKIDDITFSGVTKKTYSAKKKTKKLAKTKSFTVSAVADSGNAIKFSATSTNSKIKINATTGKITVKKGLKKGTYKITVKAKTAAGNGYAACKESKTYTIKVK